MSKIFFLSKIKKFILPPTCCERHLILVKAIEHEDSDVEKHDGWVLDDGDDVRTQSLELPECDIN